MVGRACTNLHRSKSTLNEEDPVGHLLLEILVLKVESEFGVVDSREISEDRGRLPDVDGTFSGSVIDESGNSTAVDFRFSQF